MADWEGGIDGDVNNPLNWSFDTLPTSNDIVVIDGSVYTHAPSSGSFVAAYVDLQNGGRLASSCFVFSVYVNDGSSGIDGGTIVGSVECSGEITGGIIEGYCYLYTGATMSGGIVHGGVDMADGTLSGGTIYGVLTQSGGVVTSGARVNAALRTGPGSGTYAGTDVLFDVPIGYVDVESNAAGTLVVPPEAKVLTTQTNYGVNGNARHGAALAGGILINPGLSGGLR